MSSYTEKLKDPRWQKKRLEILERDEWKCQFCDDSESTLHVHHRRYIRGSDPWDYPPELLVTLCEDCHEMEREGWPEAETALIDALRSKFWSNEVHEIATGFEELVVEDSWMFASALQSLLCSPEQCEELSEKEWASIKPFIRSASNG